MSRKIEVQFEVRERLIMEDTLKQMGYTFNEHGNVIQVNNPHVKIDCNRGSMSYDSAYSRGADEIKQRYMVNFYRDKAIREGNQVREETTAKGEVVISIIR